MNKSINERLTEMGFSLDSSTPIGKVDGDWPCVAYQIKLKFNGEVVLVTEFKLGVGCVDPSKGLPKPLPGNYPSNDNQRLIFHWARNRSAQFTDKKLWASIAGSLAFEQKIKPALSEVLNCLIADGAAFFSAYSFPDWCSEMGYDSDSIKAKSIFDACVETGRQLSSVIPKSVIDTAREIAE